MKYRSLLTMLPLTLLLLSAVLFGCREPDIAFPTPAPAVAEGSATLTLESYPGSGPATATATPLPPATRETPEETDEVYLPALQSAGATATPTPAPTNTPPPTPTPTIDFQAVREMLRQNQQELAFSKIGLHVGPGGNPTGIGRWMRRLDEAGVPFFLKSADYAGPIWEAQEIVRNSDVPHTLVYRRSGPQFDYPDYSLPPAEAARRHWELHKAEFPAELDPNLVWIETINEVDKGRAEWLGEFALETGRLALADGYRWAAFGWASGEPEPADWQTPAMLEFLRLAGANPDRLAVALHEYSYDPNIQNQYPYLVGRFQELFRITDAYGIPRPTVLITEWGWEATSVPGVGPAIEDIAWASRLYAHYPQVKGAAIWYLGPGYEGIADQTQALISPLTEYALGNYFALALNAAQAPIDPGRYGP